MHVKISAPTTGMMETFSMTGLPTGYLKTFIKKGYYQDRTQYGLNEKAREFGQSIVDFYVYTCIIWGMPYSIHLLL